MVATAFSTGSALPTALRAKTTEEFEATKAKLWTFMREDIYPNEQLYAEQCRVIGANPQSVTGWGGFGRDLIKPGVREVFIITLRLNDREVIRPHVSDVIHPQNQGGYHSTCLCLSKSRTCLGD